MNRNGFSLFEVMIAMTVCVSGIALIVGMLNRVDQMSERNRLRIESQQTARNLSHQIKLAPRQYPDTRQADCGPDDRFWYSLVRSSYPPLPLTRVELTIWPKTKEEWSEAGEGTARTGSSSRTGTDRGTADQTAADNRLILVFLMPASNLTDRVETENPGFAGSYRSFQ